MAVRNQKIGLGLVIGGVMFSLYVLSMGPAYGVVCHSCDFWPKYHTISWSKYYAIYSPIDRVCERSTATDNLMAQYRGWFTGEKSQTVAERKRIQWMNDEFRRERAEQERKDELPQRIIWTHTK